MANRFACDEDGWVDYEGACADFESLVYADYESEYNAILDAIAADETGAAWEPAMLAIAKLATSICRLSDTDFGEIEAASKLETMIERDL